MSVFYDKEGYPLKCKACGGTDIEAKVRGMASGLVTDREYICQGCGITVAYWSHGYFDSFFRLEDV